jgi:hypothetical protein
LAVYGVPFLNILLLFIIRISWPPPVAEVVRPAVEAGWTFWVLPGSGVAVGTAASVGTAPSIGAWVTAGIGVTVTAGIGVGVGVTVPAGASVIIGGNGSVAEGSSCVTTVCVVFTAAATLPVVVELCVLTGTAKAGTAAAVCDTANTATKIIFFKFIVRLLLLPIVVYKALSLSSSPYVPRKNTTALNRTADFFATFILQNIVLDASNYEKFHFV